MAEITKKNSFLYEKAKKYLSSYIINGRYSDGDKLPTLKVLADELTEGKLKPLRIAVEALVEEGILVTQRGSGITVVNVEKVKEELEKKIGVKHDDAVANMPYVMRFRKPTVKFSIIEVNSYYSEVWLSTVRNFNELEENFNVELQFNRGFDNGLSSDVNDDIADIVQFQSFKIDKQMDIGKLRRIDDLIDAPAMDVRYKNLLNFDKYNLTNYVYPLTGCVYCLCQTPKAEKLKAFDGVGMADFSTYLDALSNLEKKYVDGKKLQTVLFSSNNVLFYLKLAGFLEGYTSDTIDWGSKDISSFLKKFESVYCNSSVYMGYWSDYLKDKFHRWSDALLIGSNTYEIPGIEPVTARFRKFEKYPVTAPSNLPVVPHYLGVKEGTPYLEEISKFLNYLTSEEKAKQLASWGHVVGSSYAEVTGNSVLQESLKSGTPVLKPSLESKRFEEEVVNLEMTRWQNGQQSLDDTLGIIVKKQEILKTGKLA